MCVCVCVLEKRERDSVNESERKYEFLKKREYACERINVCGSVKERDCVCMCV